MDISASDCPRIKLTTCSGHESDPTIFIYAIPMILFHE